MSGTTHCPTVLRLRCRFQPLGERNGVSLSGGASGYHLPKC
jgi:hypothetical protein